MTSLGSGCEAEIFAELLFYLNVLGVPKWFTALSPASSSSSPRINQVQENVEFPVAGPATVEVPILATTGTGDRFFYSVTHDASKGELYLKLVNASSVAQPVEIAITGAGNISATGTLVSLTGTNDAETNTISDPKRIVPVKSTLKSTAAKFTHTVPAYSVQVIELQAK